MVGPKVHDLDYLVVRLHGRRGRVAAGERLDRLCHCRDVRELARTLYPNAEIRTTEALERRILDDWAAELWALRGELSRPQARVLEWMVSRLALENVKLALRTLLTGGSPDILQQQLIGLPAGLGPDALKLAAATSLPEFIALLPEGAVRRSLQAGYNRYAGQASLFLYEAMLDRGYFGELLARAEGLASEEDRAVILPIIRQEADIFHLMLALRGRFFRGLDAQWLLPLHVENTAMSSRQFAGMIGSSDVEPAVGRVARSVLASAPPVGSTPDALELIEAQAWGRLLRLAEAAFGRCPLGFGAVVGYAMIRRMEVANLIKIAEGLRMGLPCEAVGLRLIPPRTIPARTGKADHV